MQPTQQTRKAVRQPSSKAARQQGSKDSRQQGSWRPGSGSKAAGGQDLAVDSLLIWHLTYYLSSYKGAQLGATGCHSPPGLESPPHPHKVPPPMIHTKYFNSAFWDNISRFPPAGPRPEPRPNTPNPEIGAPDATGLANS